MSTCAGDPISLQGQNHGSSSTLPKNDSEKKTDAEILRPIGKIETLPRTILFGQSQVFCLVSGRGAKSRTICRNRKLEFRPCICIHKIV